MNPSLSLGLSVFLLGASSLWVESAAVPFVLPWNDATAAVADLSAMNPPIGPSSRVTTNALGQFAVKGERIRFLGMNFAGDSPFMSTNKADGVAGRLSKFGINNVRFHHMDAPWATGGGLINYGSGGSRTLQSAQLDRFHYLISRLKAHGVYANINLLVGREFKSSDGLPAAVETMDWKDQHVLGFFNDTALALHKEYATRLLTPTNRYTQLPLALDPAVAFVELQNENGIIQKWLDGGVDKFPPVFAQQLQARWNSWLSTRYTDTASLVAGWKIIDQPLGVSMIQNGHFTQGTKSWVLEQNGGAQASMTVAPDFNGLNALRVQTTRPGGEGWHVQWNQEALKVTNLGSYTVSFWAKSLLPISLDASVMQAHADWRPVGYAQSFALSNSWQQVSASFQATSTDADVRINFGGLGVATNVVWIADVRLQPGGRIGALPGASPSTALETRTVPLLHHGAGGYAGTFEARKDWMRFLVDLETSYWITMRDHVRNSCGYPGLIFGTILGNSPANVQGLLDVVDAHGYWQHPDFAGSAWDPVNWTVGNRSMVNSSDNTFTGLARQRVKGKPFVVTEYQHPSPNSYGAEGSLIAAAYGALQDWDGIWFFDYGPGEDSVPMGLFRGYFDTAQHPSKMANLMIAAALFRRGDVRSALGEITLALPPAREIEVLAGSSGAWNVASAGLLGLSSEWPLVKRVSLGIGPNAPGLNSAPAKPAGSIWSADTGELKWDQTVSGKSVITINTPRSKAVIGFSDAILYDLGGVRIRPGKTSLGWSTVGLSLVQGQSITNQGTSLLVVSGEVTNTAMAWTDATKTSVGNHWGSAPTMVEVVPLTVTLPVTQSRLKAWTLDERGQRKAALAVGSVDGWATLSLDASTGTLWYELEVSSDPDRGGG